MRLLLVCALAALPAVARAQPAPEAAPKDEDMTFSFESKEKAMAGTQHYRYTDTYLDVGMPYGFDFNADFTAYKLDGTSTTPTVTIGAGKNWGQFSLSGSYAITALANDYRSNAVTVDVSAHTDSKDYRTTVGGEMVVTHNSIYIRFPAVTKQVDITQRTPALLFKQQFLGTRFEFTEYQYTYNVDIPLTNAALNKVPARFTSRSQGATGLIAGFPDHSEKFGLYQELGFLPVTVWANYQSIHLIDTVNTSRPTAIQNGQENSTSDTETYGADVDFLDHFTGSIEYQHVRQTGQPPSDQYGLSLSARF